jgi:predicted CopG family antitoxin
MKKKLTLTIDDDVYDGLEDLPRKVSVSEFVNFMLKAYIEIFKRGGMPTDEQLDEVVEKMGGEEFRERLKHTFPSLTGVAQMIKNAMKEDKGKPEPTTKQGVPPGPLGERGIKGGSGGSKGKTK